jgi:charged multivesicular body protein 4A/B
MSLLFGKKKAAPAKPKKDPTEVIAGIAGVLDTLEKREQQLVKKQDMCVQEARVRAAKKDKSGALFALKQKKFYEGEITKLQGARMTLFQQRLSLESTATNKLVFEQMQQSLQAMKDARGNIDSDAVEDLVDDMAEEQDISNQIGEAISRPTADMFDDEELNAELAALEEEALDAQLMGAPAMPTSASATAAQIPQSVFSMPSMPAVPTSSINAPAQVAESEDERALRELSAAMM